LSIFKITIRLLHDANILLSVSLLQNLNNLTDASKRARENKITADKGAKTG
jgi:hypothetical protein